MFIHLGCEGWEEGWSSSLEPSVLQTAMQPRLRLAQKAEMILFSLTLIICIMLIIERHVNISTVSFRTVAE